MKKKKRNFITKIFSLLLLGIISITLLGSWTYNPSTDTITSENLFNINDLNTNNYILKINNNKFQINSGDESDLLINNINWENNTQYTFSGIYNNYNGNVRIVIKYTDNTIYNLLFENGNFIYTTPIDKTISVLSITYGYNGYSTYENFMIVKGTNIIPYEPYGTYVNKNDYDSLQDRYNLLEANYELLENQISDLQTQLTNLQIQYENLEVDYQEVYDNYQNLNDEYNSLLEEKQELQQQLADLNNELASLRSYIFNSSDIVVKIGNSSMTGENFVVTSVVSNVSSYFDVYGSFDLDSLYSNYSGFGSTYNAICFEVPNYNLMLYNVSFSFTGFPDMLYRLNYQDSVGNNLVVANEFKDSYTDLYGFSIVSGLKNSSLWDSSQPIEYCTYSKIVFVGLNVGALNVKNLNFSSSAGYSEGFNQGYNSIKNQTDLIISRLNNQIDSLNATIDNLHTQINDLQNQLSNSIGWRPLFFAMADTPLKVVSSVLGFELFGINLFQAFIGIITALAIIWLIRKIWK